MNCSSSNGKHNGWDKNKDKGSKLKSNNGLHLGWYKRADQPNNPANSQTASDASYQITNYINDISLQNAQVIETSNKDGVYDRAYTNGLERISEDNLTMTDDMKYDPLYYVNDGKGNVTELTDGRGVTRDRYRYDPYGVPIPKATIGPNPVDFANSYRYNGEDTDIVTGLQYLRARYYEPTSGRFLTRDSYLGDVTEPLTLNRYAYAVNNPIMYSDPSGHRIMPLTESYDETDEQKREYSLANQNYVVSQEQGYTPSALQYGSQGDEVRDLQQKLLDLGYSDVGSADGDFGNATQTALIEFQNSQGLTADGIAGRGTLTALSAAMSTKRQADQYALVQESNPPTTNTYIEQKVAEKPAPPKIGCDGSAYIGNGANDYKTGNVKSVGDQILEALFPGADERARKAFDSPYDFANYALIGIPDAFKKVNDTKPFTAENLEANMDLFLQVLPFLEPAGGAVESGGKKLAEGIANMSSKQEAEAVSSSLIMNLQLFGKKTAETEKVIQDSIKALGEPINPQDHHIIPAFRGKSKPYAEFIEKLGINVDDYTITVSGGKGGQHMNFIHGKAQWNQKWMDWIDSNLNATAKDVFQFAGKMMDDYGLSGYEIHPYGK